MKVDLVQQSMGTSTSTIDFTSSVFSGDVKGAIFWITNATANDSATSNSRFGFGATDGTNQVMFASAYEGDGTTPGTCKSRPSDSITIGLNAAAGGALVSRADTPSILSNGVRLTRTTAFSNELCNCLLIGGSDTEFKCLAGALNGGGPPSTVTLAHGLSGAPDALIFFTTTGANGSDNTQGRMNIGTWVNGTYASLVGTRTAGANGDHKQAVSTTYLPGTVASLYDATVNLTVAVDATNVVLTYGTAATATDTFHCYVIAIKNGSVAFKNGTMTTPTSTSTVTVASGMSTKPQACLTICTRMTALDTRVITDAAAHTWLGCAAYDGSTTKYAGCGYSGDDAANPLVEKSWSGNAAMIRQYNVGGSTKIVDATAQWDSGGVSAVFGTVDSTAYQVVYLAFGSQQISAAGGKRMLLLGAG